MTVAVELPPEMESRLRREAERQGLDVGALIRVLLDARLPDVPTSQMTPAERAEAFRIWADQDRGDRLLSDAAMRRESYYEERG